MPANVIHLVVDALRPAAVDRLAQGLVEPSPAARKAMMAALPLALLALAAKASTTAGADQIRDAIHDNRLDASLLDTLAQRPQLGAPAGGFLAGGVGGAERLMAGPTAQTAERLALYADVRRSSAHALLALSVPLLLAALTRAYSRPLDTSTVQRALQEQAANARHAVPPGFGPPPVHTAAAAARPARPAPRPRADGDGGGFDWRIPAILAFVAFFGLGFYAAVRNEAESRRDGAVRAPLSQGDGEMSSQTAPVAAPPATPGETLARELDAYLRSDAPAPQRFRFEGLHFEKSSSELGVDSRPVLDAVAAVLRAHPQATLRIEGHTDSKGGREKNERLSEERAAAVAVALMERGVEPPRVSGMGLGESRPIASNDSELGREQNRRTELVITGKGPRRG